MMPTLLRILLLGAIRNPGNTMITLLLQSHFLFFQTPSPGRWKIFLRKIPSRKILLRKNSSRKISSRKIYSRKIYSKKIPSRKIPSRKFFSMSLVPSNSISSARNELSGCNKAHLIPHRILCRRSIVPSKVDSQSIPLLLFCFVIWFS